MSYSPIIDGENVAQAVSKINETGSSSDLHINGSETNPHGTTSADVGLGNADNTSDNDKPVSTAQQMALNDKVGVDLADGHVFIGGSSGEVVQVPITAVTNRSIDAVNRNGGFTAAWNTDYGNVNNEANEIVITLPSATIADIGKSSSFWIRHSPANHKIVFKGSSVDTEVNGITSEGVDVAKAVINSNYGSFKRIAVYCFAENDIHVEDADSAFNALRYVANFNSTSDYSPYSYLELSTPPVNFMTRNESWWFAVKIEQPMKNDSDGQVLFGTPTHFCALRGNGTYFMSNSTSGYLQSVTPNTIPEAGEWVIYQWDKSTDRYTAWINGTKVLNATTSGSTPPLTPPSSVWFGYEGSASGYGYPLQTCKISVMALGSGLLSDADAATLTKNTFVTSGISSAVVTNQWKGGASGMSTEIGLINLTANGSSLIFEEL